MGADCFLCQDLGKECPHHKALREARERERAKASWPKENKPKPQAPYEPGKD